MVGNSFFHLILNPKNVYQRVIVGWATGVGWVATVTLGAIIGQGRKKIQEMYRKRPGYVGETVAASVSRIGSGINKKIYQQ